MQNYKELKGWEKVHEFTVNVYEVTTLFPKEELYSLTNQLRKAASPIPATIAEGCGKNTQLDFANFLNIAVAPADEPEYFLIVSKDPGYLKIGDFETLIKLINEIKGMLISLVIKVRATT